MTRLKHDWFPGALPENLELGEGSWLHSAFAFHHNRGRVRIGAHCGVYSGTQFELGPNGSVEIGCFSTVVGAIIVSNGHVSIGDHTFIAHNVFISAVPFACPPDVDPRREPDPEIDIGSGAWIGAGAVILGGARIGVDAIVGAGTVVSGEIPAGATAVGNPVRVHPGSWHV